MRWPFGRKSSRGDGPTPPSATDAAAPTAAARPDAAWRSLPAIQRTIGAPPVVAPAAPFAARLATRQPPELALEVLGHEVSSLAAPGLLIGRASPTGAFNSGRIELPVQRAALAQPATLAEALGWSSFDAPDANPPSAIQATADATGQPGPGPADSPKSEPPAVQRSAPRPILTTSTATSVDAAPAGRLDLRSARVTPLERRTRPATPLAPPLAATPVQLTPMVPASEPSARRPTLGQARRLGLGAPLRSAPEQSLQRIAQPGPADASATWVELGAPSLPIARSGPAAASPSRSAGWAPGPAGGPTLEAGSDGPPEVLVPGPASSELAVVRPISIQRLAAALPAGDLSRVDLPLAGAAAGTMPGDGGPSGAVMVQRNERDGGPGSPATVGPEPQPGPADAGFEPTDVVFAAAAPFSLAPTRTGLAGSLLEPRPSPAVRPARVRAAVGTAPEPVVARSIAGPIHPSGPVSVAALGGRLDRGSPRSEPVGPVVQSGPILAPSPPSAHPGAQPAPTPGDPAIQRAVEIRELGISTQESGRPAGAAQPDSGGEPAGGAAPISAADRDRELDELARRLYGRIRSRFAAELLADRERAGLLVDLR